MKYILGIIGLIMGLYVGRFSGWFVGLLLGFVIGLYLNARHRLNKLEKGFAQLEKEIESLWFVEGVRKKPPKPVSTAPPSEKRPDEMDIPDEQAAPAADTGEDTPGAVTPQSSPGSMSTKRPSEPFKPKPEPSPPQEAKTLSDWDLTEWIKSTLSGVNMIVRIGMLVLFFGVGFLLKYAVDHDIFPIWLRLVAVALGGAVLLFIGIRVHPKRPSYALVIQGGAIGVLYLDLFAASKIYGLVPIPLSFALMVAVVILTCILAVLQDSLSLAIFGQSGGFLAPVLMSTGAGDHVFLFSYYAVLNAGILIIAWFKLWRLLNLIGFFFTFTIGGLWGYHYYHQKYFHEIEPFLILNFLFYSIISILYAARRKVRLSGYVDGGMVFGLPIIAFSFQAGLVEHIPYGLAWSAAAMSAYYLVLAMVLLKREVLEMKILTESFFAIGVVFLTLALPLAFDGRWTSAAWALEGAALVWIGIRQDRVLARLFGMAVQFGSGIAFLSAFSAHPKTIPILNGDYMGCFLVSAAALFSSAYLERRRNDLFSFEKYFHIPMLVWGLLWWFGGGTHEIDRFVSSNNEVYVFMIFIALSVAAVEPAMKYLKWKAVGGMAVILLPIIIFFSWLSYMGELHSHPMAHWGVLAWPLAVAVEYRRLTPYHDIKPYRLTFIRHILVFLVVIFIACQEADHFIDKSIEGGHVWPLIIWSIFPCLVMSVFSKRSFLSKTALKEVVTIHRFQTCGIIFVYLLLWNLSACFRFGKPTPLSYIPLLNPLDITQIFLFITTIRWAWSLDADEKTDFHPSKPLLYTLVGISIFFWMNAVTARMVHFYAGVPYDMDRLFDSFTFQTAVSILWTVISLAVMTVTSRLGFRKPWFAGAGLLIAVVIKLCIVDLDSNSARIISFISVGILMLLIGYLSPAPPHRPEEKDE